MHEKRVEYHSDPSEWSIIVQCCTGQSRAILSVKKVHIPPSTAMRNDAKLHVHPSEVSRVSLVGLALGSLREG